MFGKKEKLKCPYCGYVFENHIGITTYYEIKSKNNDTRYHKEFCDNCGELFLANGENSEKMVDEDDLEYVMKICW